jgi:hypothetical protein
MRSRWGSGEAVDKMNNYAIINFQELVLKGDGLDPDLANAKKTTQATLSASHSQPH